MTDAWFENSIEKSGPDGEGCRHSKAMTSKNYLRNLIPVTAAAEQITKPTEDCASPGIPLLYLWGLLQYAAIEIPGCQSKIVDLLLEIQNRPDVHITEQQREGALSDSQWTLWKHLPHFGHDRFRFELVDVLLPLANRICEVPDCRHKNRKCVEGLARLADTLEDETAVLVIEMIVVRGWVENAGEVMFEMCIKELQDYRLCNAKELSEDGGKGQRELWEGEGGASLERWRFWKERLGDIEKNVELVEETREAARVSREIMERY